jgi:hypothetical protein
MAREGVPLIVIQRQLGHSNLGITSVYLQVIRQRRDHRDRSRRRAPMSRSARRCGCDRRPNPALLVAQSASGDIRAATIASRR